jgi:hypothetical protein
MSLLRRHSLALLLLLAPLQIMAQHASAKATCRVAKEELRDVLYIDHTTTKTAMFTFAGLVVTDKKGGETVFPYNGIKSTFYSPGLFLSNYVEITSTAKKSVTLFFPITPDGNAVAVAFKNNFDALASFAKAGHVIHCTDLPADTQADFDAFKQQTTAWRALTTKPAESAEVHKYRLLAEDALANQNMNGVIVYYEDGVEAEPTWAQGWFNLALAYAEAKIYGDAAYSMAHYIILMPNAPDVAAAKDNVILWVAKAQENAPQPKPGTRPTTLLDATKK